jgi:hypothetical protein
LLNTGDKTTKSIFFRTRNEVKRYTIKKTSVKIGTMIDSKNSNGYFSIKNCLISGYH